MFTCCSIRRWAVAVVLLLAFALAPALARSVHVRGYYRKNGTYVHSYTRSSPGHHSATRSYRSQPIRSHPRAVSSRHKPSLISHGRRPAASRSKYYRSGARKHRSVSAKKRFLRAHGLKRVPPGYEVDHIRPLAAGGSDTPGNMELLPKSAHHAKTARESRTYRWHRRR